MKNPNRRQMVGWLSGIIFALLPFPPAEGKQGNNSGQGNGGNAGGQGGNGPGRGGGQGGGKGNSPPGGGKGNSPPGGGKGNSPPGQGSSQTGAGSAHPVTEQDRVLEAVRQGRAQPLRDFLPWVESRYKARVIDVALRETGGTLLYELKMLSGAGRIFVVSVDAATGRPRLLGF